jgi:hypothetical protein
MSKNKTLVATGIVLLFVGLAFSPVTTAEPTQNIRLAAQEFKELDEVLSDLVDKIAEAHDYDEVLEILNDFKNNCDRFPNLKNLLEKIIDLINKILNLLNFELVKIKDRYYLYPLCKDYKFIISYGTYNRLNPFKDNEINIVKPGFTMWRYHGKQGILNKNSGRTVIIDRHPFNIKRLSGTQVGLMKGFTGVYFDIESERTGKTYTFFMGRAVRAFGIELMPLSKVLTINK